MGKGSVLVWSVVGAAFLGTALLGAPAHEHGVANLNIALEGQELEIELETPLANILSYEHAPQNAVQEREASYVVVILRAADRIFGFPSKAECKLQSVSLESEAIGEKILGAKARSDHDDHDHEKHADHDEHADHEHEGHADLDAEFVFNCKNPKALTTIEVNLFKVFPNLKKIEAKVATEKGQGATELTPKNSVVKIAR
ncbi:MAG: DUF2796 domain-containing protein [Campylobacteraceae bacterium]|jgi:hypothetical protein|nr:DUF2796 domain-containing protein [Campylobacteraceae bacterium]